MTINSNIYFFTPPSGSKPVCGLLHLIVLLLLAPVAPSAFSQAPRTADAATSSSNAPAPPLTGAGPYSVDITVGYSNYQADLKTGAWYPVWATVEARKADLEGEITIQQPRNQLAITIPIQVVKGTRKRYMSYYCFDTPSNPELDVAIRFKKLKGEAFKQPIRFADDTEQHILALADEPGSLAALNRLGIDTLQSPTPEDQNQGQKYIRSRRVRTGNAALGGAKVIYGDPELLPEDPIALDGIDGMVINTRRVRALNKRQWDALGGWVARGGRLLLAGGKNQPFIEQSVAKGAFGISLTPAQPAPMAEILGSGAAESLLASWPAGGWTRLALGDAQHPLIAGKPVGRGWFYACAVALDGEVLKLIARRDDSGRLWPELLERHQGGTPLEQVAQENAMLIGADLQRPFSVNLAGTGWVLGFLGIYIVLVLPVNWFICGRLKRREWAWPVAIAIALAFTWYGTSSGLRSQSSVFQVNELAFVMHPAGAAQAHAVTFSAVFSPRRYRTDLQADGGVFANRLNRGTQNQYGYYYDQGDLYSDRNLAFVFSPTSVWLGDFFFHPWSARNLRSDFTLPMSGGVEALSPLTSDARRDIAPNGVIVNRSPWRFKRWWVSDGQKVWEGHKSLERMTSVSLQQTLAVAVFPGVSANMDLEPPNPGGNNGGPACCADIVRDAIAREFFKVQDLRDSANINRRQYGNPAMQSMVPRQAWLASNMQSPRGKELFFIGEAETGATPSPMLERLKLEKRSGVLLYEAALPLGEADAQSAQRPTHWTPMLLDLQNNNGGPYPYGGVNPNAAGGNALVIRAEPTDVQLVPDRAVKSGKDGLDGALTLALRIANYPDEKLGFIPLKDRAALAKQAQNQSIDPATGMPINDPFAIANPAPTPSPGNANTPGNNATQPPRQYCIAGCPVLIYNLRQARWEATRILEDGRHTVSPARDYLAPGTSALLLRVDAEIAKLVFKAKQDKKNTRESQQSQPDPPMLKAKEIFGDQVEQMGFNGQNNSQFSSMLQLKDISVTLGDATTTSTLERRAQ